MSLKRHTIYNIAGSILPISVSLVTVPLYLKYIGVERYGVLAIIWMLLGYFGFFDLGLPRAIANQIAKMRDATMMERQEVVWAALVLNAGFGLLGGLAVYLVAPPLVEHVFKMSNSLRNEVMAAMPWMALAIPIATITGVLVGALDGRERFLVVNVLQSVSTIMLQIIPLAVAIVFGVRIESLVVAAVLVRLSTIIMLFIALKRDFPHWKIRLVRKWIKPLLSYGGWISITGFSIPILEGIDRFMIGAVLGARAVAIYTVPSNLVRRLRILPSAVLRTLFPRFSAMSHGGADDLALRAILKLTALFTPLIVVGMFLMKPFLSIWVGNEIAHEAAPLAVTFLAGMWINGIAHIPFGLIEAKGRPDLIAKLHLFTLPVFGGMLWLGAHWWGVQGVALAWTARVWLDSNILLWLTDRAGQIWRKIWPGAVMVFIGWGLAMQKAEIVIFALMLALTIVVSVWAKYRYLAQ